MLKCVRACLKSTFGSITNDLILKVVSPFPQKEMQVFQKAVFRRQLFIELILKTGLLQLVALLNTTCVYAK